MQGFILHTQKVKDEDLIVYILTKNFLIKSYRFYGLRHSNILSGYKIDFELEQNLNYLPRLKDVVHLGYEWIMDREKMFIWQEFIMLLYKHLKDVESVDEFYFKALDESVIKFSKQNSIRVIVDFYVKLLEFEGRLNRNFVCFSCDEIIKSDITLLRAFLPSHQKCAYGYSFDREKILEFYENKNSSVFCDNDIKKIYSIIKEGL